MTALTFPQLSWERDVVLQPGTAGLSEPGVLHMSCGKPGQGVKGASGSVGTACGAEQ